MSNEDVLVLVNAPVILNLECVPSLQDLLIGIVTASNYAARREKLEFPIVIVKAVKCNNISVSFCLSHSIIKLTHTSFPTLF